MRAFDNDEDHHDASSSAPKPNFEQGRELMAEILLRLPVRSVSRFKCSWRGFRLEGSLLNGTLHWLLHNDDDNCSKIIAFDVIKRKLSEIPLPFYDFFNLRSKLNLLMVMGGYLCVYSASYLPA
ncbi:hypothetical protein JHK87_024406 [Glycine soja]|nr:hypothetical protein JHK87_024406 [Glycine soja]